MPITKSKTKSKASVSQKSVRKVPQALNSKHSLVRFKGCSHFRQRIACSILSGKSIRIDDIRSSPINVGDDGDDIKIGLIDFEASFLRLIDKITNGTKIEINESGTSLYMKPGFIMNGKLEHDCGCTRGVGWYLEGILPLAFFGKKPLSLTLNGITNDNIGLSADSVKAVALPLLKKFGIGEEGNLDFKVTRRGSPPKGGGSIELLCPIVKRLKPIDLTDAGLVKRIRGNAVCTKVSPQIANRTAESSKGVLNKLIPDVWVHTDHSGGISGGLSPGFSCCLVAESTTGVLLSAEFAASEGSIPEDLGIMCSHMLLEEISNGGCVDSSYQSMAMLLMVLCPEDVSRLRIGKLTNYSIAFLRHIREFFGVTFKIKPDYETSTVLVSCLGIGYKNISRSAT